MTGNATEEWLMTRLDYPGHMDASRFAGLSGSATAIVAGLTANEYVAPGAAVVIGLGLGFAVGGAVYRRINQRTEARRARQMAERRAAQEAEAEAQIARMKNANT